MYTSIAVLYVSEFTEVTQKIFWLLKFKASKVQDENDPA